MVTTAAKWGLRFRLWGLVTAKQKEKHRKSILGLFYYYLVLNRGRASISSDWVIIYFMYAMRELCTDTGAADSLRGVLGTKTSEANIPTHTIGGGEVIKHTGL